jgi:hypothetical protein
MTVATIVAAPASRSMSRTKARSTEQMYLWMREFDSNGRRAAEQDEAPRAAQ